MLQEDDEGACFEITTSIPVSLLTSGTELVISLRLSKVMPGQAKSLSKKLLKKTPVLWEVELATLVGNIISSELVPRKCFNVV